MAGKILQKPELAGGFTVNGVEVFTTAGKVTGQLYWNDSGKAAQSLKVHNHLTTSGIGSYEGKSDTTKTSGAFYGLWQDANLMATGTTSATAVLGVATVASGKTITGGTLIGTYGQARADGTMAGSGFMAGLYGLVEEGGGAITASHVCSAWLDSHRNTAVTGNHELLYMTNNGSATMDSAIYLYAGDKITNFLVTDTASGMVATRATPNQTATCDGALKVVFEGKTLYIPAYNAVTLA